MRIELHEVTKGRRALALPATSVVFETERPQLAIAETEQRPTVLGLIASGRMGADTGTVTIDGRADAARLRRQVALVDAPDVCDPAPDVTVAGIACEELMFAGRPSNPISARRWLEANGFGPYARTPVADIPPHVRIALLLELTALRDEVRGMVLVSPDRHGGDPIAWWRLVEEFARRGYAMLAIAGVASAMVLRRDASVSGPVPEPGSVPEGESAQSRNSHRSDLLPSPESPVLTGGEPAHEDPAPARDTEEEAPERGPQPESGSVPEGESAQSRSSHRSDLLPSPESPALTGGEPEHESEPQPDHEHPEPAHNTAEEVPGHGPQPEPGSALEGESGHSRSSHRSDLLPSPESPALTGGEPEREAEQPKPHPEPESRPAPEEDR
ncbi:hypothetical protein [Microbacterium luticocti]|uniref:hypothetical protein n=1 Tax=Microbacterium luticocti TaxID=451764 RepID=UPI00042A6AF5|nr:hypothetical protein [Microbacterium luticocti]